MEGARVGERRKKREGEREGEGRGAHLGDPNPAVTVIHLGHDGEEREVEERKLLRGKIE
jgi:hypothetical protein